MPGQPGFFESLRSLATNVPKILPALASLAEQPSLKRSICACHLKGFPGVYSSVPPMTCTALPIIMRIPYEPEDYQKRIVPC